MGSCKSTGKASSLPPETRSSNFSKTSNDSAEPARTSLHEHLAARADGWFKRARAASLEGLPCGRGCHHCCIGPFAITTMDVEQLQVGLNTIPANSRTRIRDRAAAQAETMEGSFPRLKQTPFLDDWNDTEVDHLVGLYEDVPCPALQSDGSCGIYEWRPVTCRLMGIPTEENGLIQAACQIQTSVPILRLSHAVREEERAIAEEEAGALDAFCRLTGIRGEEVLLPYGFLPDRVLRFELSGTADTNEKPS